jgi:hypothetical protein
MATQRSCSNQGEPVKATLKIKGLNFRRQKEEKEFKTMQPTPKVIKVSK